MVHVYVQLDFAAQGNPTECDLHLTHSSLSSLHSARTGQMEAAGRQRGSFLCKI